MGIADAHDRALYVNKINPALWQDVNQVEKFGFLSMSKISPQKAHAIDLARDAGPTLQFDHSG